MAAAIFFSKFLLEFFWRWAVAWTWQILAIHLQFVGRHSCHFSFSGPLLLFERVSVLTDFPNRTESCPNRQLRLTKTKNFKFYFGQKIRHWNFIVLHEQQSFSWQDLQWQNKTLNKSDETWVRHFFVNRRARSELLKWGSRYQKDPVRTHFTILFIRYYYYYY